MPLTHEHQVNVLKDILYNQSTDCCGTVAECEQMERLIKSLMANTNIDHSIKNILEEIYYYSQAGKNTNSLDDHITGHQDQLSQWVDHLSNLH